ncbi:50S ribosomal protein L36 [Vibrio chagasii]|nr:50S ribosomal protein L36 [Vibrio chagasii]
MKVRASVKKSAVTGAVKRNGVRVISSSEPKHKQRHTTAEIFV